MSLLDPDNLWWLLPLGGILVSLYFLKPRRQVREVPSLYLWSELAQNVRSDTPLQRLKLSLLLLLQAVILMIAILALGRPFGKPNVERHSTVALIVETSATMNATDVGPNRLTVAKEDAAAYVSSILERGDRACVIVAGATPVLSCPLTNDKSKLMQAISAIEPQDSVPELSDSLVLAKNVSAKPLGGVILFSDGVWKSSERSSDLSALAGAPVWFDRVGTVAPSNVGITSISERTDPLHPDRPSQALVTGARLHAAGSVFTLTVNGALVSRKDVPAGDGTFTEDCSLPGLRQNDRITAHLSGMARDDLSSDNTATLIADHVGHRRILLVTNGSAYLERALALLPDVDVFEVTPANYYSDPGGFDLVVFDRWLPQQLPPCPVLAFGSINDQMPAVPSTITPSLQQIVDWDESDPLLSYVDLSTVRVQSEVSAVLATWGTDVADFPSGTAMAKGNRDGEEIVWVAFAPDDSDFPLHVAFPIFLSNAVDQLASLTSNGAATGSAIMLAPTVLHWRVNAPDGHVDDIQCGSSNGCIDSDTSLAGLYKANGDGVQKLFAMNVNSSTESEFKSAANMAASSSTGPSALSKTTERLDLAPWFVSAALVLALIEWLVYNRSLRYTRP
jgi:Ca-activated chloride channel homolog